MLFADEKRRLFELVINHRITKEEFVLFAKKHGIAAPDDILKLWRDRFFNKPECRYNENPRYINGFCVGADPEFVFGTKQANQKAIAYIHSAQFGMNTLEAFGSDMTGRQAEIRAYPSKSVLEVVASILDSFRHLADAYPQTLKFMWLAPAVMVNDGCGGHVHIGRKRPDMKKTLQSLNSLTNLLIRANVVDKVGSETRKATTLYGKPSDFRLQPHGYEYRTMPTWLDNVWSAFLVLTLSKLCIFHQLNETASPSLETLAGNKQTIENLLRTYANVDEDARIALVGLVEHGLPKFEGKDFKGNWGIESDDALKAGKVLDKLYYPPIIAPTNETCKEVFYYITASKKIPMRVPTPNWKPFKLSENVMKISIEEHRAGISEIAAGLLSKGTRVVVHSAQEEGGRARIVLPAVLNFDKLKIRQMYRKAFGADIGLGGIPQVDEYLQIFVPTNIALNYVVNKDKVALWRHFLTSGLFPISRYETIQTLDVASFYVPKKKEEPEYIGSVVDHYLGLDDPLQAVANVPMLKEPQPWEYASDAAFLAAHDKYLIHQMMVNIPGKKKPQVHGEVGLLGVEPPPVPIVAQAVDPNHVIWDVLDPPDDPVEFE